LLKKRISIYCQRKLVLVEENLAVRRLVSQIHLERLTDNYFNTFEGFKHEKKDYATYSDNVKAKVDKMNAYVKEILANGNDKSFNYMLLWFACVAQGIMSLFQRSRRCK
jgi:hypothetical protein